MSKDTQGRGETVSGAIVWVGRAIGLIPSLDRGKCIMICLESLTRGWTVDRHLAFLETSPVSDIQFWKPVYQLFKPDEPLMNEALRDFCGRKIVRWM